MKYFFTLALCILVTLSAHAGRSVFRTKEPCIPTLKVRLKHSLTCETLQDSHLEEWPLFYTFDKQHFDRHMLPLNNIAYRYHPSTSVPGSLLGALMQTAVDELRAGKKRLTHFTILKERDFTQRTGLIVLKFKEYPFVAKLFIEDPQGFVTPWEKSFEATCFFYMGGGMNRHLMGFTRIKNVEYLEARLALHPYWHDKVYLPRKWFWLPNDPCWLVLEGKNIGTGPTQAEIPGIYAVVADYIQIERTFTLQKRTDRRTAFALSAYLKNAIDSHIDNFVLDCITKKIVILDTEHFPTLVGLRCPAPSKSYLQWYMHLSTKMAYDVFGRSKCTRYMQQQKGPSPMHIALSVNV